MPRPKASFSEYKHLFNEMNFIVDENNFNTNSKITITCKNNHEYITSITKIKSLAHDYKNCPHCKKEEIYNDKRISLVEIEAIFNNTTYKIINKKEFYSKWTDTIELECKNDNHKEFIKSINYWINEGKKIPICPECTKIKTLSIDKFNEKLQPLINSIPKLFISFPIEIYNKPITSNVVDFIKEKKWKIKEYNGTKQKSIFICECCGSEKNTNVYNLRNCNECIKMDMKHGVNVKLYNICKSSNIFIDQLDTYQDVNTQINFKCNTCNNNFSNSWAEITGKYYRLNCPNCYASTKRKTQNDIFNFVQSLTTDTILSECRDIISPKEIDIFIPSKNIGIEYCGNIWHSEKYIHDSNHHYNKMKECKDKGVFLITIFEDEWVLKNDICKSRLKSLFGAYDTKIFAKQCIVNEVDDIIAKEFLDLNHFQGSTPFTICYGLYYNNVLVSVMAFKNMENTSKQHDWELVRFSCSLNTLIVGGASKLLTKFIDTYKHIHLSTFSDSRWSTGNFYEKIGFKFDYDIPPSYYYVGSQTGWRLKHRFTFNKQRMIELFKEDPSKTEHEMALNNGLFRIYDCGHKKFSIFT